MKYYRFTTDSDKYHSLILDVPNQVDFKMEFRGDSKLKSWKPKRASLYKAGAMGSFPYLSSNLPVFDRRAKEAFEPLLGDCAEYLPLRLGGNDSTADLYLVNVLCVIDPLDIAESKIQWAAKDVIRSIDHFVMDEKKLKGIHIFRIKGYVLSAVFVDETFRKKVEEEKFQGLVWKELP